MDDARIAELLSPFLSGAGKKVAMLSPVQFKHISMYIDILMRWNARVNLTAVREPEEIVTRHFGESIFAARHLFPRSDEFAVTLRPTSQARAVPHVIDVGSGPGFPGLPIKIWASGIRLTLIESNQKKATFLREVVRALELTDVEVFAGRAEAFPKRQGDVVTLRAVERFEASLPIAAGLLGPGARLALLIGQDQAIAARQLAARVEWDDPVLLPLSNTRILIIGSNESI